MRFPFLRSAGLFFIFSLNASLLCAQWQPLPGPDGGSVSCWAQSSTGNLYAGGSAGIFKSDDGGKTWKGLAGNGQISHYPTELDWDNGNLYMATQAYNSSNRALWKSTDDGANWISLRNDLFDQIDYRGVFDARNDTIVVNASPTGFLSKNGGLSWETSVTTGVWNILGTDKGWFSTFYSTVYKWSSDIAWLVTYQSADPAFHPIRLLEAGDKTFMFFSNGPSFKVSDDGGATWQDGNLPISYTNLQISAGERNDTIFIHGGTELAYSTDDAQTWSVMPSVGLTGQVRACLFPASGAIVAMTDLGIYRAEEPGAPFLAAKGFASQDVRTVSTGVGSGWWIGTSRGLFFSPDNGNTWQKEFQTLGNLSINWVQQAGLNVVAGNDTIFMYSPDGGANWERRVLPNVSISNVELFENEVFVGACSGTWHSQDWGQNWQEFSPVPGGAPLCTRIWEQKDSLLAVAGRWSEVYLSLDSGLSWQDYGSGLGGLPYTTFGLGLGEDYLYVVSGYRLMRSPRTVPQWTEVNLPFPVTDFDGPIPRAFDIEGDVIRAGIPFVGIYRSVDSALNWSVWNPSPLYQRSNSFHFYDSLTVMTVKGGVWYVGNLPGLDTYGGRVYVDLNENQSFDSLDVPLAGHLVQLKNQQYLAVTDVDGRYAFNWRNQADSLHLILFSDGATVSPTAHYASGPAKDLDFAVSALTLGTDLAVDLSTASVPRPGFSFNLFLTCRNDGYLPSAGTVFLTKDPSLNWIGFSETPAQITGDTVRWLFPEIAPGSSATFSVTLQVDPGTALATLLYFSARATLDQVFDPNAANNTALLVVQVLGSYDPNDKSVEPRGPVSPAAVAEGQDLVYTVRFQNTGTFPAEFVRITDTLSPNLDLATLRVLATSHALEWTLKGNVVEFYFPNIQLPDSTSDEPGSHGFVKFSLRMRPELQKGEAVENFADIYFDFNTPVRTNTVQTRVDEISGIHAPAIIPLLCQVIPNPVRDVLTISWTNPDAAPKAADLEIYDQNGRRIRSISQANSPVRMPVHDLPTGHYWLKIHSNGQEAQVQWIKM